MASTFYLVVSPSCKNDLNQERLSSSVVEQQTSYIICLIWADVGATHKNRAKVLMGSSERTRDIEFRKAGYNIELSSALDNSHFDKLDKRRTSQIGLWSILAGNYCCYNYLEDRIHCFLHLLLWTSSQAYLQIMPTGWAILQGTCN
ncbi:uncharacterized protein [Rutidosis leptorrhynchoides]|uniref:uncharacterized protein n=1 Tax=Rutidosis leptorrhynchoides TaxID=125765 RepID=UPI003A9980DB